MTWELLERPGESPKQFGLSGEGTVSLLAEAVKAAKEAGLPWPDKPLTLAPAEELVKLVRLSQLRTVAEGAEG
jgi:hypothetical protein